MTSTGVASGNANSSAAERATIEGMVLRSETMKGRTRRRHLRYRVANAGRRAMHVGLRRSIALAERVRNKLVAEVISAGHDPRDDAMRMLRARCGEE
jgi:hypothetical protein